MTSLVRLGVLFGDPVIKRPSIDRVWITVYVGAF